MRKPVIVKTSISDTVEIMGHPVDGYKAIIKAVEYTSSPGLTMINGRGKEMIVSKPYISTREPALRIPGLHILEVYECYPCFDSSNYAYEDRLNKKAYCGMGTTMAMIAIDGNMLYTAHCGDSRIYYCFEYGGFRCVNRLRDHIETTSEGWPYIAKEFVQGESRHIPEIHQFKKRLQTDGRFLICSDGVYNTFKDKEFEDLLKSSIGIDELTGVLHERCDKAARDNNSAIIIEIN